MGIKDLLTPEEQKLLPKLSGEGGEEKNTKQPTLPPFPIEDLPWPYRDLLELIAPTTEAPIEGLLLAIFCALGAALGRKVAFPTTPILYPMIWGLLLAPPYFYRKGSVLWWAVEIARMIIPELKTLNGLGSIERANKNLSEREGVKLFCRVAELCGTISKAQRSGTSNLIPDLCDLYDHVDGWEMGTKDSKPCVGYEFTLLGLSTLKALRPIFRETYISGGFLRRLVIVQASERPPVPDQPLIDREKLQNIVHEIKGHISQYGPQTTLTGLDPEAKKHYAKWYIPWREKCLKLPEHQMEVVGGTESLIRKLALQRAAIERKREIPLEILAWAIRWAERFQAHALAIAGQLGLSYTREIEERIIKLLEKAPRRPWEIQRGLHEPPPAMKLRQILDGMVDMGMITTWGVAKPNKGAGDWYGIRGSEPSQ